MRLFVAAEIPERHKASIDRGLKRLCKALPQARWTGNDSRHITLKFFGEVPDERLEEVVSILRSSMLRYQPIITGLTHIGGFPSLQQARVLWLGIDDCNRKLANLATRIEKSFDRVGFHSETRKLRPHITLARFGAPECIDAQIEKCGPYKFEQEPIKVEEVVLFQSHLGSGGARYEPIARAALTGKPF